MALGLTNPWFLIGALAVSVPILLHLAKRERAQKIEFSTLMFLRKVSKKTIRYQKLRHWILLLLRIVLFLLLTLAFARPFRKTDQAAPPGPLGPQASVILLDNSLSMAHGDCWDRARRAAAEFARRARLGDKLALLEFSNQTVIVAPLSTDPARVLRQIESDTELTDRSTRYGQALRVADKVLLEAGTSKRVIYLISDFQKSAWAAEPKDLHLSPGIGIETFDVGSEDFSNVALGDVQVVDVNQAAEDGVRVKGSVINYGTRDRKSVRVGLLVDGPNAGEQRVDLSRAEVLGVDFRVPRLADGLHRIVVEVEDSELTRDNRHAMILESRIKIPVLSVENAGSSRGGPSSNFFLTHALNLSSVSPYRMSSLSYRSFASLDAFQGQLLVWNDAPGLGDAEQERIRGFVRGGGGLLIVVGDPSLAADFNRTFGSWLPVRAEDSRAAASPGRRGPREDYVLLTDLRVDHPIFRPFGVPHSGSFSDARFYKYARLSIAQGGDVIARFDNGDPALVSIHQGNGRVLVFASSADDTGNNLPLKAVFAPFWHQMLRYLENSEEGRLSLEVGESMAPRRLLGEAARRLGKVPPDDSQPIAVFDPLKKRVALTPGVDSMVVDRVGFYEARTSDMNVVVAVNAVPSESDLTHADSEEMVAGWLLTSAQAAPASLEGEPVSDEEQEKRQQFGRFLLLAVAGLLIAEGVVSNLLVSDTAQPDRSSG